MTLKLNNIFHFADSRWHTEGIFTKDAGAYLSKMVIIFVCIFYLMLLGFINDYKHGSNFLLVMVKFFNLK